MTATADVAVGTEPTNIIVTDFNSDGVQDFLTANATSNDVTVALGDGQGGTTTTLSVPTGAEPTASRSPILRAMAFLTS